MGRSNSDTAADLVHLNILIDDAVFQSSYGSHLRERIDHFGQHTVSRFSEIGVSGR